MLCRPSLKSGATPFHSQAGRKRKHPLEGETGACAAQPLSGVGAGTWGRSLAEAEQDSGGPALD